MFDQINRLQCAEKRIQAKSKARLRQCYSIRKAQARERDELLCNVLLVVFVILLTVAYAANLFYLM